MGKYKQKEPTCEERSQLDGQRSYWDPRCRLYISGCDFRTQVKAQMKGKSSNNELIIVPVFNEERTLEGVLKRVKAHSEGSDILVVDDGSTDGSGAIVERSCRIWPNVNCLVHETNLGYGRSLIDGFNYAIARGYEFAVTIDCDEQHEPCLVPGFFRKLRESGCDVVSGSRYLSLVPKEGEPPPDRLRINRQITAIINQLTGYNLTDAFCGFKGYRVAALKRLELTEDGYGMPVQFWLRAAKAGLSVCEMPVPLIYKPGFERRFGGNLDDAGARLKYYLDLIEAERRDSDHGNDNG